ncbi:TonB-dependent receptor, partial [Arcticibacter svalbardensis]|uniref:TonB-dependent receptor n=1 Tax=Arcticibacter svalbardensis TaxID=1288027 RepID=UPI001360B62E
MKITVVLIAFIGLSASASTYAQNINLSEKNISIEKAIGKFKQQSGYIFWYESKLLKDAQAISINIKNGTIRESMDLLLKNQPLNYTIVDNTIVINEKIKPSSQSQIPLNITGKVTDDKGLPLPGVSVTIKGSQRGTVTDKDGIYKLVAERAQVIVYTFIGFKRKEATVADQLEINISLEIDNSQLNDVVVVAYGKQKKSSVVSAISSITAKQLSLPTRNLSNNLGGQIAGLISIQRSGEPGNDDATFWIRGISTFAGGTSPLILVDGIPRAMNDIEPDEIESFSILKDAAATAVYGAEGANGVVLVTTKRGQAKKGVISFKTEQGISQPTRLPKFVGSAQYMELANEALNNDGISSAFTDEQIANYRNHVDPDLYPDVNWMDELLQKNTTNHRYTMNFRGGTEKTRYFVSGAFYNEDGVFKNDPGKQYDTNIGLKRYNLRSNIDIDVTKTTILNVDISGQYVMLNDPGNSPTNIFRFMLNTPPYIFPGVYSDGTLATYPIESDGNNRNPYNMLMNSGYTKEWRTALQSNVGIQQKLDMISKGLSFNGKMSFDYSGIFGSSRSYNPSRFYATGRNADGKLIFAQSVSGSPDMGEPSESNSANNKVYIEGSLNYSRIFGKHTVSGMALYNQKETQYHNEALAFRKQGMVGRLTYSFSDRYFIEGNFGYTGSEAFAAGHRFGFFPAVGVGYYISNENFYPEQLKKYITSLKLRASIGRTGNDATGTSRFLYRSTYNTAATGFNQGITSGGGSNYAGAGIVEGQFGNNNLSWEIEDKKNFGIDIGLFNNKLDIVADYFDNTRSNILLQRKTIPTSAGFQQFPWENYGKVNNKGIDGSVEGHLNIGPVKVGMRGTFTYARNKI